MVACEEPTPVCTNLTAVVITVFFQRRRYIYIYIYRRGRGEDKSQNQPNKPDFAQKKTFLSI